MNKILRYSFVALLAMIVGNVMADDITFTAGTDKGTNGASGNPDTMTKDGITISGTNLATTTAQYRIYANSTLTISSTVGNISKVVFNCTASGDANYGPGKIKAMDGYSYDGSVGTWQGSASSIDFETTAQVRASSIVVTIGAGSGKKVTTIEFSGDYETRATCGKDESVNLPTATVKSEGAAVAGATVTWESNKTDIATIDGNKVKIANGTQGEVTIKASYAGNDTYDATTKSYKLTVYKGSGLLKELVKEVTNGNEKWDNGGEFQSYWFVDLDNGMTSVPNTVTFASGKYIYLTDGTNNLLFYGTNSKELKKGDKVSGDLGGGNIGAMWGKLYRYHKLPEFSFTEMDIKVVSEGNVVEPKTITFDKLPDNLNAFVKIENVVFDGTAYKIGDEVLTIKDQFNVVEAAGLEANTTYTIEGMVGLYDETHQLYPISFTKQGGGSDPTPSGDFYAWEDGMEAANKLTFADGSTVQITGNESKTIGSAKKITIDGNEYTTLKISNGAENTFVLPAGKKAKNVTFYSYVNKATAEAADRDNYWADVNGTAYDAAAKGTMKDFTDSEDYLLHPDVYTFELGGVNSFTFKNAGYQPCIVIRVALDDASNINTVKTAIIDGTRYNLAGQKVDKSYKGVVIMNGKKMIQK
jgi:hypothetical protein